MAGRRQIPLVVILGATGTGKSRLALELGQFFSGEIISADSMQVYKELDIITNKVSEEERRTCPHHLIDFINQLQDKGKLPIIVGGTNYYIEALLWNFLIQKEDVKRVMTSGEERPAKIPKFDIQVSSSEDEKWSKYVNKEKKETFTMSFKKKIFEHYSHKESVELHKVGNTSTFTEEFQFVEKDAKCDLVPSCEVYVDQEEENDGVRTWSKQVETEELYEKVREIDPISGQKIHPNDRRKIVRALEVYEQYGVPMSAILKRQHDDMPTEVQAVSGPLRYSNSCVLWIQCKQDVLDDRLDRRVDSMLESGLLQELATFHKLYNQARLKESRPPDYTLGIFQSIGFKEFHEYLILPENIRDTEKGKELLQRGIEDLKRTTRRYSRKQTRWIRNRFLKRPGNISLPVYALNFTDLTRWEEMVYRPATQIVQAFIENKQPDRKPVDNEGDRNHRYTYNVCEVCDGRIFVNENDWKAHINGKKHKKMVKRKKKEELSNGDTQDSQQMVDENPAS